MITFAWRFYQFFSGDINEIVEKMPYEWRHVEQSFRKFLNADTDADGFLNLINSSFFPTDTYIILW